MPKDKHPCVGSVAIWRGFHSRDVDVSRQAANGAGLRRTPLVLHTAGWSHVMCSCCLAMHLRLTSHVLHVEVPGILIN